MSEPRTSRPAEPRRRIPPMDRLLAEPRLERLSGLYGREAVRIHARAAVAALRRDLAAAGGDGPGRIAESERIDALPAAVERAVVETFGTPLARVLNATGVFLHTNLGRAPLPREVAEALPALADAACDLELDLATGRRGERNRRARALLVAATGAEDALVANNNAGAMVLALATLAAGREVIVSRGELVEIGGSFRVPDILAAAGARLVEVGTTNRVRRGDYEAAIGPETALLLKVFPSNYRIVGFVEAVAPGELAALGRERGLPVLVDEGSGLLRPHPAPQLSGHPSIAELVAAGCDLVAGSGDKLLGGPQAGLLAGRRELVERCRRHPLYRALRPDRMTFAALEAVLRRHLAGEPLPLDRLWPDAARHRERLERLAERLPAEAGARVVPAEAQIGGGSAPERPIPGEALALEARGDLAGRLRAGTPPVVGYVRDGRLILDLRTIDPCDDEALGAAVEEAFGGATATAGERRAPA